MIVDELLGWVGEQARNRTVSDVRVGLGYTAVRLDNGACGLAYTFREEAGAGCSAVQRAGTLTGRPASEVVRLASALDAVTAAVGVAALNALVEPPPAAEEVDIRDAIQVRPDDMVGMVGYFGPLVGMLRASNVILHIFERRPRDEPEMRPDWAAPLVLPECDVAIISATTLINRTIDGLLECVSRAREVILVGPSAPLLPEVFRRQGITLLSGVQVVDGEHILRVVSEGGGTHQFGRGVRKLCVRL